MKLSNLVRKLEEEVEYMKRNSGIEKDLVDVNLYKYTKGDYEEGYILAKSEKEALVLIFGDEETNVSKLMDNKDLILLIKNKHLCTYLLPF